MCAASPHKKTPPIAKAISDHAPPGPVLLSKNFEVERRPYTKDFAHAAISVDNLVGSEIVDEPSLIAINRECQPPRPRIKTVDCPSSIWHRAQQVRREDAGRLGLHHHRVAAKPDPDSVPYIGMSTVTADQIASRDFEAFIESRFRVMATIPFSCCLKSDTCVRHKMRNSGAAA